MAKEIRTWKMVSTADAKELINMDYYTLESTSFIMEWFGLIDGKRKYNPYDIMIVPPNSYGPPNKRNKNTFRTTIGLFIFNRLFVERYIFDVIPYVNTTVSKGVYKKINKQISYAVLDGKMPLEKLRDYLLISQKIQPYGDILCWSFTEVMFDTLPMLKKLKDQLYKTKYGERIKAGDPKAAVEMEHELLEYANELLDGDPSYDMLKSGAKTSFGNNFKNLFVMRGAIKNPLEPDKFEIVMSNYLDGIDNKEDYIAACQSLTTGPYSRSKKTAIGGYLEKLVFRASNNIVLLPHGTDCKTKKCLNVYLTNDNFDTFIYSNIVDHGKLVCLNSDNKSKYLNTTVKFRNSSLCESEKGICSACAGELFYKLGITNIGATLPQVASSVKLYSMKAFHDLTVRFHKIDLNKVFNIK